MNWVAAGALILWLSTPAVDASPGLIVELATGKAEQLVGEPADLHLVIENKGSQAVAFSESGLSVEPITLRVQDTTVTCVAETPGLRGAAGASWTTLKPGDRFAVKIPAFRCLCPGTPEEDCDDWLTRPGLYTVRMGVEHHASGSTAATHPAPPDVWEGRLASSAAQVRVLEPQGVDAQVWAWSKEKKESPFSVESLARFPSSRYAALALYPHLNVEAGDPAAVKAMIDRGRYLATASVPDPAAPEGWTSLSGQDLARWRIGQAERILKEHPGFPYSGQLRLAIGVNHIALGKKAEGRKILADLSRRPDTSEGAWARRFLAEDAP